MKTIACALTLAGLVLAPTAGFAHTTVSRPETKAAVPHATTIILARHGADDAPGDDRGGDRGNRGRHGGGHDDGPNHG